MYMIVDLVRDTFYMLKCRDVYEYGWKRYKTMQNAVKRYVSDPIWSDVGSRYLHASSTQC